MAVHFLSSSPSKGNILKMPHQLYASFSQSVHLISQTHGFAKQQTPPPLESLYLKSSSKTSNTFCLLCSLMFYPSNWSVAPSSGHHPAWKGREGTASPGNGLKAPQRPLVRSTASHRGNRQKLAPPRWGILNLLTDAPSGYLSRRQPRGRGTAQCQLLHETIHIALNGGVMIIPNSLPQ